MWSAEHRIAVFDLDEADCVATAAAVRTCLGQDDADRVVPFSDMQAFTGGLPVTRYAMAFMGVDSMLGVEAARILRAHDADCPLFLLSNTAEYALEGYRLHALDYILKPASVQRLREAMDCMDMQCLEGIKGAHYG